MSKITNINDHKARAQITADDVLGCVETVKGQIEAIAIVFTLKGGETVNLTANVTTDTAKRMLDELTLY